MKRLFAALAVATMTGLSACTDPKTSAEAAAPASAETPVAAKDVATPVVNTPATPITPGAPAYAALYPGAELSAPVTTADGASGPGGMATFTTVATPDAVVDFYKGRAEAAGLASISAMDQGEARAYAAADTKGGDASVQVVAAPGGAGETSVQLVWSAGE